MEVALRRLPKFSGFLNQKYKLWYCPLPKYSSIATQHHGKHFQTYRNSQIIGSVCETEQQQLRKFSLKKSKMADAKIIPRMWHIANNSFAANGQQIKVVSYNILAQDLLVGHLELYMKCNPHHLQWNYRLPKLTSEIVGYRPDILCLQEVQENHLHDIAYSIKRHLPLSCVFKKKTGMGNDGCAIFFNKNVFDLVESDAVEYFQPGCERLDRHNIAVIVKLRCKSNPDYVLLVCTTHLLYNPRRQDVRLAQLMVLLAELDRHVIRFEEKSGEMRKIPLILTGDFNFPPDSAPYELLSTGKLSYEKLTKNTLTEAGDASPTGKVMVPPSLGITDNCQHIDCVQSNYKCNKPRIRTMKEIAAGENCKPAEIGNSNVFSTGTLTHSFNLTSIFNHIANPKDYGSTFHEKWITVDHFFFSSGLGTNSALELMAALELPSVAQCVNIPPLPSGEISSDHLLLAAKFNLAFSDEAKPDTSTSTPLVIVS